MRSAVSALPWYMPRPKGIIWDSFCGEQKAYLSLKVRAGNQPEISQNGIQILELYYVEHPKYKDLDVDTLYDAVSSMWRQSYLVHTNSSCIVKKSRNIFLFNVLSGRKSSLPPLQSFLRETFFKRIHGIFYSDFKSFVHLFIEPRPILRRM